MRHRYVAPSLILLVVLALIAVTGCGKGVKTDPVETVPAEAPDRGRQPAEDPDADRGRTEVDDRWADEGDQVEAFDPNAPIPYDELVNMASTNLRTIYFGYDSFELSSSSQRTLRDNAEWLMAHPELDIVIEGHCDERGTIEYNLALGEKRASSVRAYMSTLGVARSRVRVVTYGEERPVDPGHSDSAWSKNRRAEFKAE